MKHHLLLLGLIGGLNTYNYAQKQTAIWFFGDNSGLDFNSGSPVNLTGSQMATWEGCTSIADGAGNLLMYSDGLSLWDKNHNIMPNGSGLLGDPSSAQSGLIVPKPTDPNTYYIFTVAVEGADGIRYSEVDMTLNGGNGDITTNKNILLIGPSSEKLTAVLHANGQDVWVVTQTDGTNSYYAYLVNAAGVSATPVVSSVGTPNSPNMGADGYIKFSPDGTKLVNAHLNGILLELFTFDAATGVISNPMTFTNYTFETPYGVEFSPNNQVLYVSTEAGSELAQYDLSSGNINTIMSSKIVLTGVGGSPYALQLGIDGKIYVALFGEGSVGVINNPNMLGVGCDYVTSGVNLSPGTCRIGLPQFITSYFLSSAFTYADYCFGDATHFTSQINPTPDSVLWNFGVNGTLSDTSTLPNPYYVFPDTGLYTVTLYSWLDNLADTFVSTVHIYGKFLIAKPDQPICLGGSATFNATYPGATYLWSNNSTGQTLTVNTPGLYWVNVSLQGCVLRDTMIVYLDTFKYSLGEDISACVGEEYLLSAEQSYLTQYLWSNGKDSSSLLVSEAGTYSIIVRHVNGCFYRDTIDIAFNPCEFIIPNVFSPNGDTKNDVFKVDGGSFENFDLKILSRWGQVLFETKDKKDSWDGKHNGKPCPQGIYYYVFKYKSKATKKSETKTGYLTLVR